MACGMIRTSWTCIIRRCTATTSGKTTWTSRRLWKTAVRTVAMRKRYRKIHTIWRNGSTGTESDRSGCRYIAYSPTGLTYKFHCLAGWPILSTASTHTLHNANDAKTFLKHFSDCLFYFCSTCADAWSRNKINSVLATVYFISAPSIRTCRAEIK